jgi:hypothetical protein
MITQSRETGSTLQEMVVFDAQGTLIDVSSARHLVECEKPDFDAFHLATADCPPHQWVVDETHKQHADGKVVGVFTGMNEKFRPHLVTWLRRHDVPFDLLLMRPNRDFRKDFIVKTEMLRDVRLRGFVVTHAWDDNPQILDMWEHEKVPYTVVPGWTGGKK